MEIDRFTFNNILARVVVHDAGIKGVVQMQVRDSDKSPLTSSYTERFMAIESPWEPESVRRKVQSSAELLKDRIAHHQQLVDNNRPTPDLSSRKQRQRQRVYEPSLKLLKELLAAKMVRDTYEDLTRQRLFPEYPRGSRPVAGTKTREDFEEESRAKAAMNAAERVWQSGLDRKSVDAQLEKMGALREGKGRGSWEFKGASDEYIADHLLYEKNGGPVTAAVVARAKKAVSASPYVLAIQLIWVEDPTKKSLIIKLPIPSWRSTQEEEPSATPQKFIRTNVSKMSNPSYPSPSFEAETAAAPARRKRPLTEELGGDDATLAKKPRPY